MLPTVALSSMTLAAVESLDGCGNGKRPLQRRRDLCPTGMPRQPGTERLQSSSPPCTARDRSGDTALVAIPALLVSSGAC